MSYRRTATSMWLHSRCRLRRFRLFTLCHVGSVTVKMTMTTAMAAE